MYCYSKWLTNCPTRSNQPKCKILFHEKSPPQEVLEWLSAIISIYLSLCFRQGNRAIFGHLRKFIEYFRILELLKVSKSRKKKYIVLDSPKKQTLGHFYVLKNAPAFVFLENLEQQFFFSFWDLLTFNKLDFSRNPNFKILFSYWSISNRRYDSNYMIFTR